MPSFLKMGSPEESSLLSAISFTALIACAAACEYLMFRVGHNNPSVGLMAMFAAWVLAPFAGLAGCHLAARRWSNARQRLLHATTLLIALMSLLVYARVALGPSRAQPAFFFLVVPFVSLVIIAFLAAWARKRGPPGS